VAPPVISPGNPTTFFTATYEWASVKAGTYLITSGTHIGVQVPMGLYAPLEVDVVSETQAYNDPDSRYGSKVTLLFSEVDPVMNAAVAVGDYGTAAYPTAISIGYTPKYFLINGNSYTTGALPIAGGSIGSPTLLRFLNAGSRTRIPLLQGPYMTVIADDGNRLPYSKQQYNIELLPGQTADALIMPVSAETITIYDRAMGLTNGGSISGGALTQLAIAPSPPAIPMTRIGVFRMGSWYFDSNGNGLWDAGVDALYPTFGSATDIPLVGDWNGDGLAAVGAFRAGSWFLDYNGNGTWDGVDVVFSSFGGTGDLPVVGDWNGDGRDGVGIFRNGSWYFDTNSNGAWDAGLDTAFESFGSAGDLPVTGDWNGDGTSDIGIFRNGSWYLDLNNNGQWEEGIDTAFSSFGAPNDVPIVGDWNGDGATEVGLFRDGAWFLDSNGNGQWDAGVDLVVESFGGPGDVPLSGIWP
jgi:hypothetical protein